MKKWMSMLLAFLLITSMLIGMIACNNEPADDPLEDPTDDPVTGDTDKNPIGTPEDNNGDGTKDDGEKRIALELPDKDYGDETYHILQWSANGQTQIGFGWIPWEEGHVEEEDGDILVDAVFARNAWVEETYGVEITSEYVSVDGAPDYATRMRNNAATTANEFQLATQRTVNIIGLVEEGLYADLNEYENYLHLDQPWWVADSITSFTLGDKLYVAVSEMLLRDKGATAALFFNQDMVKDYTTLPDFFELVREGAWTIEELIDACETVAHSNDGDDLMNSADDVWGMTASRDYVFYSFNALGYKFAEINSDGYMEATFGADTGNIEHNSVVDLKMIHDDVMYAEWFFNSHVKGSMEGAGTLFVDGQALFDGNALVKQTSSLKEMESLYGILPQPKLDEDQENYSSLVWMHYDSSLGIPAHATDKEMSAIILEALSWESYYSVYPIFYETILLNRTAKEEDSKEMLKLIFNTRSYDPGQYWGVGGTMQGSILNMCTTGGSDVAGLLASSMRSIEEDLQRVNGWIDEKQAE